MRYRFRPQILPTLLAIVLIAGMIKLGFWQYGKAEQKRALQATYDARLLEPPKGLPGSVTDIEAWRYRRVVAIGNYMPERQILLDNQIEGEAAGYHVLTPFRPDNAKALVLVDRGWIPVGDRSKLPVVNTPAGRSEISGFVWVPSTKFYELAKPQADTTWQPVWQNMDMAKYLKSVRDPVLPFVLRLDADRPAGFVRNWVMPAERTETHIGYAWQWWGFSVALFLIWIFVNIKKEPS